MKTIYRKDGWTTRLERTSGSEAWIVLSESGIAEMEGNSFSSWCTGQAPPPRPQGSRVRFLARQISNDVHAEAHISRLTITEGRADHYAEAVDGKKEWSESFGRIHLAVDAGPLRMSIDRGGSSLSSVDPAEIRSLTSALAGARTLPASKICNVRLAPAVTARIIRELVDAELLGGLGTGLQIAQRDHEDYPYDGWGRRTSETVLLEKTPGTARGGVYRPTYRLPPIVIPLHIRLEGPSNPLEIAVRAIEILQPLVVRPDRLSAGLLCLDAQNQPFACGITTDPRGWLASIRSVGGDYRWFPYSAGAYGSEVDQEDVELSPLERVR